MGYANRLSGMSANWQVANAMRGLPSAYQLREMASLADAARANLPIEASFANLADVARANLPIEASLADLARANLPIEASLANLVCGDIRELTMSSSDRLRDLFETPLAAERRRAQSEPTFASVISRILPDTRDSASRPADATPFRAADLYPVVHIRKPAPKKTAPDPVTRLENSGNSVAASYSEKSIALLETGNYADSARASICAIESEVREVAPKMDFGKVIDQMRRDGAIPHSALAEMIKKLWGYGSDQPDIRHADYPSSPFPAVGYEEALLLSEICPAIAAYLAAKLQRP